MDWFNLTAPCGMDCFNCELYEGNITPETRQAVAPKIGKEPGQVSCKGCRAQGGCFFLPSCATLQCITEKGLNFCSDCGDFPCVRLAPCAQGADKYPHNFKLYNLCRIKKVGLENWAVNEAGDVRKRYFQGRFAIGTGPNLE